MVKNMFENVPREKVLEIVKSKGPLIPIKIVKEVGGNTFVIGAVLSDLMGAKLVRATQYLRVGSSPLYYVDGQEEKLLEFTKYLNEKDRRILEILRQEKVMHDFSQDPLVRVSLRNLKDFAKPFALEKDEKTLFWKFYLVTDSEAARFAKELLKKQQQTQQPVAQVQTQDQAPPAQIQQQTQQRQIPPVQPRQPQQASKPAPRQLHTEETAEKETPPEAEGTSEAQKQMPEFLALKEKRQRKEARPKAERPEALSKNGVQENPLPLQAPPGSFADKVFGFLQQKGIAIKEVLTVKKGEAICIVSVPSPVGSTTQYCKAKQKKNISDGDVATSILEAQNKGFPLLLLATGQLSKKAQPIIEQSKNASFVQIP